MNATYVMGAFAKWMTKNHTCPRDNALINFLCERIAGAKFDELRAIFFA
jgi:hypothetical protein